MKDHVVQSATKLEPKLLNISCIYLPA
ncbi:MAG: hypothetical protein K0Q59_688, partial [Paenibacillus sp.]|nr:hypothetical protein [Paenibacillus sp.]